MFGGKVQRDWNNIQAFLTGQYTGTGNSVSILDSDGSY